MTSALKPIIKVAVIGCGWLGLPLAKQLVANGHTVMGSTRNIDKHPTLKEQGIEPVNLILGKLDEEAITKLKTCHCWIINIPPGRHSVEPEVFTQQMFELIDHVIESNLEHLVFVSTTSVYGDQSGVITELSDYQPTTKSGIAHQHIEQYITTHLNAKSSIIRLAGLVDEKRHPVHFLASKQALKSPCQAVNLIHKEDVCSAIIRLVALGPQTKPLLLAASEHPSRNDYYRWAAKSLGLVPPEFIQSSDDVLEGKKIDSSETLKRLGLTLKYESPYQMLEPELTK